MAKDCQDVEALYGAAYTLYEHKLHGFAATLLTRADRLAPGQARIVAELGTNLEAMLRYHEARRVVEDSGLAGRDGLSTYLLGFYSVMCGDLDGADAQLTALARATGDIAFMREQLAGMVLRARALEAAKIDLGEHSLTAWHAAINGSLLLHESPHGYDQPMRGRYAYVGDGPALMKEGIDRLRKLLEVSHRRMSRVVSAPDRASRILAHATARSLELPLAHWHPGGPSDGLFVAWNLDAVGEAQFLIELKVHSPDQILFAHASAWVDPPLYAPDVTTLLYQSITHPYLGGGLVVDPETKQTVTAAPDQRDDETLAGEILRAPRDDGSVTPVERVLAIHEALGALPEQHALGVNRRGGARRIAGDERAFRLSVPAGFRTTSEYRTGGTDAAPSNRQKPDPQTRR